jgi:hypothetical protein
MSESITVFFVIDGEKLVGQAYLLASSFKRYRDPNWKIIAYVRADSDGVLPASLMRLFDEVGIEVHNIPGTEHGSASPWKNEYPIGNKILAASAFRETEISVFLDTDIMLFERVDFAKLLGRSKIAAVLSDYRARGVNWQEIYSFFKTEIPRDRPGVLRRPGLPYPPYFNAGVIIFRECLDNSGHRFGTEWLRLSKELEAHVGRDWPRKFIDQVTLPVLGYQMGSPCAVLPQKFNFNIQAWGAPNGKPFSIIHYHDIEYLWRNQQIGSGAIDMLRAALSQSELEEISEKMQNILSWRLARELYELSPGGCSNIKMGSPYLFPSGEGYSPAVDKRDDLKIILHLGPHNTGTTYLQDMLDKNEDLIRKAGISLARMRNFNENPGTHWRNLLSAARRFTRKPGSLEKNKNGLRNVLVRYFDGAVESGVTTCFISEENLLGAIPSLEYAIRGRPDFYPHSGDLAKLLAEVIDPRMVKVIFRTRQQHTLFKSIYRDALKFARFDKSIDEFICDIRDQGWSTFRFDRLITPWQEAFGEENVFIRPFEEIQQGGPATFVQNFLDDCGIIIKPKFSAEPINEGISPLEAATGRLIYRRFNNNSLEFKRALRRFHMGEFQLRPDWEEPLDITPSLVTEIKEAYVDDIPYKLVSSRTIN